tara:strand:- start:331 stop:1560 length:1230 start_codon:yes stop_codon:yes gene_type:complete
MSGKIQNNTDRQSGVIGSAPSATTSSSNPTISTNPATGLGTEWHNTSTGDIFLCFDATTNLNKWKGQRTFSDQIGSSTLMITPTRGLISGGCLGDNSSFQTTIDYVTIDTLGNATDFGDLTEGRTSHSALSNGKNDRAIISAGGVAGNGSSGYKNNIDYVTVSTPGNAQDWGDLASCTATAGYEASGPGSDTDGAHQGFGQECTNGTNDRGMTAGGYINQASNLYGFHPNFLIYTIPTTGTCVDSGKDLLRAGYNTGGCANGKSDRAVFAGQNQPSTNVMQYTAISTVHNAIDFGDLTGTTSGNKGCSSDLNDRGIFNHESGDATKIQYITISTTGNAADFGDLLVSDYSQTSFSSGIGDRACFAGGGNASPQPDQISYITISSTGNSQDFGNLSQGRNGSTSTSDGAQ